MVLDQQTPYLSYVDGSEQHEPGTVFKHYHFVINMYFDRFAYHYVLLVGRARRSHSMRGLCDGVL